MTKFLIAAALIFGLSSPSRAQFCPGCIQNSGSPQNAQMNITSATIRGPLYVGSLTMSTGVFTTSVTAGNFVGSGTYITNLNASELLFGAAPSAALSGSYTGITGVGALSAGSWNGSIVSPTYGGTGSNLVTASTGAIPYFIKSGSMTFLAPGTATQILQTNGATSGPSWTSAPQVLGTNVTAIPMANVSIGSIPVGWLVSDVNISTLSAAKVIGNIPGNATNITGNLSLLQLSTGTLINSIVASSVTASGVSPGIWGGPSQLIQATVGYDGRITSISQSSFTVNVGSITAGPLPVGVTIGATQITAGALANTVIASSLTTTGVTAGAYGSASQTSSFTVRADGRLSLAGQVPIAINTSQINNGTLTSGVLVPSANVQSGALGGSVIASSVAASGVSAGTYGGTTTSPQITIGPDGRVTLAISANIAGASTHTALNNVDNAWSAAQTNFSSVTINANLKAQAITATSVSGNGSALTNLDPTQITAGTLNSNVIASAYSGGTIPNEVDLLSSATFHKDVLVNGHAVFSASATAAAGFGNGFAICDNTYGTCANQAVLETASGNVFVGNYAPSGGAGSLILFGSNDSGQMCLNQNGNVQMGRSCGSDNFGYVLNVGGIGRVTDGLLVGDLDIFNSANLSVTGNSYFGAGTTSVSTISANGSLAVASNSSITLSGSTGYLTTQSSVTASAFFGDGSHLANLSCKPSGGSGTIVCQGSGNALASSAINNTISGGSNNLAGNNTGATIAGGDSNTSASLYSSVGGGQSNTADGNFSCVPGGANNFADGNYSVAMGRQAHAANHGSFVFADDLGSTYFDAGAQTFNVRATNGAYFSDNLHAAFLYGDGSNLTNVIAAVNSNTALSSFTVLGNAFSVGGSSFSVNGSQTYIGGVLTTNTSSSTFNGNVKIAGGSALSLGTGGITQIGGSASFGPNVNISAVNQQNGNLNVSGNASIGSGYANISQAAPANGLVVEGSVGIGTQLPIAKLDVNGTTILRSTVWISTPTGSSALDVNGSAIIYSTFTVQGNAFSVGGSTLSVSGGTVSIGTMTISGSNSPPNEFALCLHLGQLGHCTSTPTNGSCTCVAP